MKKELYEKIISLCLENGCDFAEIYYEEEKNTIYNLTNSILDDIITNCHRGVGIRVAVGNEVYYTSTNDLTEENLLAQTKILLSNIKLPKNDLSKNSLPKNDLIKNDLSKNIVPKDLKPIAFKLNNLEEEYLQVKIPHSSFPVSKKIAILKEMDKVARSTSELISQVKASIIEKEKTFTVANSFKKFISSNTINTRLMCIPYATKNGKTETTFKALGKGAGYEFLDSVNYREYAKNVAQIAVKKLDAIKFKGGKVPAILGPGFGAVIFHEACGHSLEATSTADNLSVFSNKIGEKIATSKVTLIDDGTIPNEWGTTLIDSEGNKTQKNILIDKGILKSYLVDYISTRKLKAPITGSARRESYIYPPTSRMNNTYLAPGEDTIEDMLKSIDYGIYCKSLAGGSVDVNTGDFNFSADECYLIEKGKITKMLRGVTLIGKGQDILNKVEMVSNDLELETGYCGSISGTILVDVGEPTIKISEILVGGEA